MGIGSIGGIQPTPAVSPVINAYKASQQAMQPYAPLLNGSQNQIDPGSYENPANASVSGVSVEQAQQKKQVGSIECQTCKNRQYQDGSDDPGVSFKAAAHISPEASGAVVRAHEYEHVNREKAKAASEDREVVSQSVRIFTSVCPECGRVYVSGGLTTTTTQNKPQKDDPFTENYKKAMLSARGALYNARI